MTTGANRVERSWKEMKPYPGTETVQIGNPRQSAEMLDPDKGELGFSQSRERAKKCSESSQPSKAEDRKIKEGHREGASE